ncbi:MAG: 50S ribosomal protein L30 [Deltaproteobacteria bacterium]|nr:50S ribosomal protein L30 [Deltaproteobacteria bacterium]
MGEKKKIKVRQTGGLITCTERQRATVRGLGLRRRHHEVMLSDTPAVRGMIRKVSHLVAIVEDGAK